MPIKDTWDLLRQMNDFNSYFSLKWEYNPQFHLMNELITSEILFGRNVLEINWPRVFTLNPKRGGKCTETGREQDPNNLNPIIRQSKEGRKPRTEGEILKFGTLNTVHLSQFFFFIVPLFYKKLRVGVRSRHWQLRGSSVRWQVSKTSWDVDPIQHIQRY